MTQRNLPQNPRSSVKDGRPTAAPIDPGARAAATRLCSALKSQTALPSLRPEVRGQNYCQTAVGSPILAQTRRHIATRLAMSEFAGSDALEQLRVQPSRNRKAPFTEILINPRGGRIPGCGSPYDGR
jgi:hypothetical protein